MADVKWIKIVTDIFDDEKILLIESMPDADTVLCLWFKLLCLAGKVGTNGVLMLNNRIAFTDEMLATIFRRPVNTIRMALKIFQQFEMIEIVDGTITIPNWSKHQNLEAIEAKREYQREYMAKKRNQQKLEAISKGNKSNCEANSKANSEANSKANVSSLDKDIDKDIDKDLDREIDIVHEAENSSKPAAIFLPLNDKSEFPISEQLVSEWSELYQAVDVMQELRKMRGWLISNPSKRKTAKGVLRFVNNWLSKEQDRGGSVQHKGGAIDHDLGSFRTDVKLPY